jgi:hypothetical protein
MRPLHSAPASAPEPSVKPEEPADTPEAPAARERRVAFESLRERTDELELIISGISLLALLTAPGWLFEQWARLEVHAEGSRHILLSLTFQLLSGLSMTLAAAFVLHLAVRAYWVGLIGLKATFPDGIRWDSVRSIGPIAREYYRQRLPDLDTAIDAADRVASIVFAMVSLVTLSVLWMGALLGGISALTLSLAVFLGVNGELFNSVAVNVLTAVALLLVLPALLLDSAWVARRFPTPKPWLRSVVRGLTALQGILVPRRLVLPVQMTLESNLPNWAFTAVFLLLVVGSAVLGRVQERSVREFAYVSSYDYFSDADSEAGLRSAYYENLRSERDVLARVPLIPADLVADGHLRLFLPYLPERDNPVLRQRCPDAVTANRRECLAGLWSVALDAKPVALDSFVPAERRDLGLRGLHGYLSLAGLAPGRHELQVQWSGDGAAAQVYRIPFWFSPPYQQDLLPAG